MSEKVTKKPVEKEEVNQENTAPVKKTAGKKPAEKAEKKENFLKRGYKKVKKGMSEHPFWTAFGGAAIGSGLTAGAGFAGKKILENRRQKKMNASYIPQGNNDTLDPNV